MSLFVWPTIPIPQNIQFNTIKDKGTQQMIRLEKLKPSNIFTFWQKSIMDMVSHYFPNF